LKIRFAILGVVCLGATTLADDSTTAPAPTTRQVDEIRRGVRMGGSPEERTKRVYEQLVRKVEPDGVGDVKRLAQYLEFFKKEFVEDPRQFAISLESNGGAVSGYVECEEHKESLAEFLKYLKLEGVKEQVELLPATELSQKKFGVVTADSSFLYDRPSGRSESLTECAKGDGLWLLKDGHEGRILCHGPGGYVGWINDADVRRVEGEEFDRVINGKPTDERVEKVIAAAKSLMGVKYVWGGLSKDGVDCSGLVQRSMKEVGVMMPRDADQQSLVGKLVATRWHRSSLRRGDLLYFIGRRGTIHHTAIYLGENQLIEAADPGVKVSSFNSSDQNYEKKRDDSFFFAKRVLE
jgi:hypothetical protein